MVPRPPRRIIVACDGTGQSSTRGEAAVSTNVNRICHSLSENSELEQIVYYQSGVGTGSLGRVYHAVAGKGVFLSQKFLLFNADLLAVS